MADGREFRFTINAYTPETIPMNRLAEYLAELAVVLGEQPSVHFVRLIDGSTTVCARVEEASVPKVLERVRRVKAGEGPPDAMNAYRGINRRLRRDDGTAVLTEDGGAEVIRFPGREEIEPTTFGPFNQPSTLDGTIIKLGGRGDPSHVHIEAANATYTCCMAPRATIQTLGPYIYGPELRFFGTGRWKRDVDGSWILDRFAIQNFVVLDDEPLSAVVARLRDIPGSEWGDVEDPWAELEQIRNGPDEAN